MKHPIENLNLLHRRFLIFTLIMSLEQRIRSLQMVINTLTVQGPSQFALCEVREILTKNIKHLLIVLRQQNAFRTMQNCTNLRHISTTMCSDLEKVLPAQDYARRYPNFTVCFYCKSSD